MRGYGVWMDRGYFYDLAVSYAYLDNKPEALAWLDSAAQGGFMSTWYLENDPLLDNIRGEPEFTRIKNDFDERAKRQTNAFRTAIQDTDNVLPEIQIQVVDEL